MNVFSEIMSQKDTTNENVFVATFSQTTSWCYFDEFKHQYKKFSSKQLTL